MPPFPFSPVGFSAVIDRVLAADRRGNVPRLMPRPVKLMLKPSSWIRYLDDRRLPAWRTARLRNRRDSRELSRYPEV